MTPFSSLYRSPASWVPLSSGTGSIRSRFSAYASTLRTICSVVWSTSCMGGRSLSWVFIVDQPDVLVPPEVGVFEAVGEVPDQHDRGPDDEHQQRDRPQVLDDPQAAEHG